MRRSRSPTSRRSMPVLVQLTGDERWMEDPYRPTPPARPRRPRRRRPARRRAAARSARRRWRHRGLPRRCTRGDPRAVRGAARCGCCRCRWARRPAGVRPDAPPRARPAPRGRGAAVGHGAAGSAGGLPRHRHRRRRVRHGDGASGSTRPASSTRSSRRPTTVGGTWWHNRYPGCGVDTPSHLYCFSFFDEYDWPAYFSLRDTLHDYFETVATDLGIRPHIRLRHRGRRRPLRRAVTGLGRRRPQAVRRDVETCHADVLVSAVGAFGRPVVPGPPGPRHVRGRACPHRPLAGGPRPHGQARRRHRQRGQRHAARAGDRRRRRARHGVHPLGAVGGAVREVPAARCPTRCAGCSARCRCTACGTGCGCSGTSTTRTTGRCSGDPEWEHPERSLNRQNDHHREYFTQYILDGARRRRDELAPHVLPTYPPFGKRMLMDNGWFRTLTRDDVTLNPSGAAEVRPHSVVGGDGAGARGRRAGPGHRVRRRSLPGPDGARRALRSGDPRRRGTTTTPRPTSARSCPTCPTSSACTGPTCRAATGAAC